MGNEQAILEEYNKNQGENQIRKRNAYKIEVNTYIKNQEIKLKSNEDWYNMEFKLQYPSSSNGKINFTLTIFKYDNSNILMQGESKYSDIITINLCKFYISNRRIYVKSLDSFNSSIVDTEEVRSIRLQLKTNEGAWLVYDIDARSNMQHWNGMDITELEFKTVTEYYQYNGHMFQVLKLYDNEDHSDASWTNPCVICLEGRKSVVCMNCRHFCLCKDCMNGFILKQNLCPMCRDNIEYLVEFNLE